MAFSGALTLTDLNDYLGPSQACIKPIEDTPPPKDAQIDPDTNLASTQIAIDKDGSYYESATSSSSLHQDPSSTSNSAKPRARTKLETAAISLDDCLACSGCVTSAESVLVGLQSVEELWNRLDEIEVSIDKIEDESSLGGRRGSCSSRRLKRARAAMELRFRPETDLKRSILPKTLPSTSKPLLYASISPQSIASLSAYLSHISELSTPIPLSILLFRISHFLKSNPKLNFDEVVDTTFARHLSLREHSKEFLKRKEKSKQKENGTGRAQLPMLASACPGWVCYAEKAQHELLDLVSKTKSPMLMNGILAKRWSSPLSLSPSEDQDEEMTTEVGERNERSSFRKRRKVFHLSIMPCYDKKLESARPSISSSSSSSDVGNLSQDVISDLKEEAEKDVDLVLTTGELVKLMADEDFDLEKEIEGEVEFSRRLEWPEEDFNLLKQQEKEGRDLKTTKFQSIPSLLNYPSLHSGSSSGGYLFSILQTVWSDYLENLPSSSSSTSTSTPLPTLLIRTIRNSDYTEYILKSPPDQNGKQELLFKGAHCYGFRNLQNLVRKVKTQIKKDDLDESSTRDRNATSGRGKAIRGKMVGRGGRGGKMVKRGGGNGTSTKISLDDDFSLPSSSSTANLMTNNEESQLSRIGNDEEDPFSNSIPYDYVEIMACPGGCVNGGGQLRPPTPGNSLFLNGKETKNLLGGDGPTGSFASGIGRESGMTEAQVNSNDKEMEDLKTVPGNESEKMQVDFEEDEEMQKKGWKGTSKQWVGKVEEAYWTDGHSNKNNLEDGKASSSSILFEEEEGSMRSSRSSSDSIITPPTSISSSILPSKNTTSISTDLRNRLENQLMIQTKKETQEKLSRSKSRLEIYTDEVLNEICRSHLTSDATFEELEGMKEALFQTKYNAVKDEAVSGLAVQW